MKNYISLIGRLVKDPEAKNNDKNVLICNGAIAVNDYYNGEEKAYFFNFVCFNKTADIMLTRCKKGDKIGISGKLTQRKYNEKNYVEIIVNSIELLGTKTDDKKLN